MQKVAQSVYILRCYGQRSIPKAIASCTELIYHISTALDVPLSVLLGQDQYVSEMTDTALRALVIEAVREALAER